MSDRVTVTTSKSWFSRIIESIKSVLVGLILFVAAFPILFWNEGRAVKTARSLEEGSGAVVSVAADSVNPANEGKLVHVSGPVSTDGPVADDELGVQADGIKLLRNVEMYQWVEEEKSETRKKLGGGEETVTTYTYSKEWKGEPVNSSSFHESSGHENPGAFPIDSVTFTADPVRAGAFTLSEEQLGHLNDAKDLPLADNAQVTLPASLQGARVAKGVIYAGADPGSPQLGDVRVSFQEVAPSTVSLVGVQTGQSFAPYQAEAGDTVLLVDEGTHTAQEMFKSAQDANKVLTWILRGGGFLAMFLGLVLVFRPISVLGDVVPLFGSLLGVGIGLFAFLTSAFLSLVTIAIAWITVRPLLGVTLLVLAGAAGYWLIKASRRKKAQAAAAGGSSMAA
ncbi:MAG: TMEM43 family protein [Acidobacteriota bacterium]